MCDCWVHFSCDTRQSKGEAGWVRLGEAGWVGCRGAGVQQAGGVRQGAGAAAGWQPAGGRAVRCLLSDACAGGELCLPCTACC